MLSSDSVKGIKRFYPEPRPGSPRFQINGIGIHEAMPPSIIHRPQGTGDFLIMYFPTVVHASSQPTNDWQPPQTLHIWHPGEGQFYGHAERPYLHSWIHCQGALVTKFLEEVRLSRQIPLSKEGQSKFHHLLEELHEEVEEHPQTDAIICENLFENWLRDLIRRQSQSLPTVPERLARVQRHIEGHLHEPLKLPQLAQMANWSVPHFCEAFQRYFATSPISYLIRLRMHHAAYLLHDINLSIGEIGCRVGYEDPYHFSKLFKKHYGSSPRAMRRKMEPLPSENENGRLRRKRGTI